MSIQRGKIHFNELMERRYFSKIKGPKGINAASSAFINKPSGHFAETLVKMAK